MGQRKYSYRNVRHEGKRTLGRLKSRWDGNTENFKVLEWEGMDSIYLP
jgi:hypothetical protein